MTNPRESVDAPPCTPPATRWGCATGGSGCCCVPPLLRQLRHITSRYTQPGLGCALRRITQGYVQQQPPAALGTPPPVAAAAASSGAAGSCRTLLRQHRPGCCQRCTAAAASSCRTLLRQHWRRATRGAPAAPPLPPPLSRPRGWRERRTLAGASLPPPMQDNSRPGDKSGRLLLHQRCSPMLATTRGGNPAMAQILGGSLTLCMASSRSSARPAV